MTNGIKKENANSKETLVIAFVGAPGVGKSTAAFGAMYEFKKRALSVEYVPEFCNYLFYTDQLIQNVRNQAYIATQQFQQYYNLLGKVDYIITDTGMEIAALHAKAESENAEQLAWYLRGKLNLFTIFIERDEKVVKYEQASRIEDESTSRKFSYELEQYMKANKCKYTKVVGVDEAIKVAIETIQSKQ